jgi:hypothetical protein
MKIRVFSFSTFFYVVAYAWSKGYRVSAIPDDLDWKVWGDKLHIKADMRVKDVYMDDTLCPGKTSLTCYFDFSTKCHDSQTLLQRFKRAIRFDHGMSLHKAPQSGKEDMCVTKFCHSLLPSCCCNMLTGRSCPFFLRRRPDYYLGADVDHRPWYEVSELGTLQGDSMAKRLQPC